MRLETFIQANRLRQKRDECDDMNALGKRGTICEYADGLLMLTIIGSRTATYWNAQREALKLAGCRIVQNGDCEGSAVFDPGNETQVKAALLAIKAFRKKEVTPELLTRLAAAREKTPLRVQQRAIDPSAGSMVKS